MLETLFTKKEAAAYMKVSQRTVDRLIRELDLVVYKVGRSIRIPESSMKKMMVHEGLTSEERNRIIHDVYGE